VATNRMEVITSIERRRRWSSAEKARLVAAMDEPGAAVREVAREAGVDASLLYRWRRRLADERETPGFAPLRVAANVREPDPATTPISASAPASITIAFGAQVRMTIEGAPDAATLASVIGALTARDRCDRLSERRAWVDFGGRLTRIAAQGVAAVFDRPGDSRRRSQRPAGESSDARQPGSTTSSAKNWPLRAWRR